MIVESILPQLTEFFHEDFSRRKSFNNPYYSKELRDIIWEDTISHCRSVT